MKTKNGASIGEIAEQFQVSTVTIRNWVNLLGNKYLSAGATKKTGKRFTAGDISTLQKFSSLLSEGFTWNDALSQLPTTPEIVETPSSAGDQAPETPSTAIQTLEVLEKFQALMKLQSDQFQTTLQAKDEHIETLKEENTRLQKELAYLKTPWYIRLFRK